MRTTIYGDYTAPAIASSTSCWHIEAKTAGLTLCGRILRGDVRRMSLHVSFLECSRCMALGQHMTFPKES